MFDEMIVGIGVLGPVVGTCTGWPAVVGAADVGIYTALFVIANVVVCVASARVAYTAVAAAGMGTV